MEGSPAKTSATTSPKNHLGWILVLLMAVVLPWAALLFTPIYFRDYAIIWEAAYRMSLGQQPYQDFTMPIGPVSLWLPAWVMKTWGWQDAWLHFRYLECALGSFVSSALCLWLYQRRAVVPEWVAAIALFIFSGYYLWPNVLPWYNTTALFLALLALLVLPEQTTRTALASSSWVMSGALIVLSFLAKQDVGLAVLSVLIAYACLKGKWPLLGLLAGGLSVVMLITLWYGPELWQQLHLGAERDGYRLSIGRFWRAWAQLDIRNTLVLLLLALSLGSANSWRPIAQQLIPKSTTVFVLVAVVFTSYMSSAMSGIPASHLYWAPFLWLGLWWFLNAEDHDYNPVIGQSKSILNVFLVLLGVLWCMGCVQDLHASTKAPRVTIEWGRGWSTDNVLAREVPHTYSPLTKSGFAPLAGPEDMHTDLDRAKQDLTRWATTAKLDFVVLWNMSEWPAVYTWLKAVPATQVPLWIDVHATVSKQQESELVRYISKGTAHIILWQPVHSSLPDSWRLSLEKNYNFLGSYSSASQTADVEVWVVK